MLYAYPMDLTGCGHYRVLYPYRAMPPKAQAKVRIVMPGEDGGIKASVRGTDVRWVDIPADCTAVLVQRPTSEVLVKTLRYLRGEGVEIILEVDDDLEVLHPGHPTKSQLQVLSGHDSIFPRMVASMSSRVVVSTKALQEKFRSAVVPGTEVFLCRNRIPRAQIQPLWNPEGEHVLGWPGAVHTHPGDLEQLGGSLGRLGRNFTIVGGEYEGYSPNLGIPKDSVTYTGDVPFEDWIPALRRNLTVGVAPLKDSHFNRSKSALKALELAAAGVPMVRNTLFEFDLLGAGIGASKSKQWFANIRMLLASETLWGMEQIRNRDIALDHTYEEHVDEWIEAWGL